jgi:putative peptide zinc metalloprotease protein
LALRGDLVWTPQAATGQTYYLVEDPLNSRFYRVGPSEYAFISLLDGRTSISEATSLTAKALPSAAFSEHEAASICNWLLDNGLVHTSRPALRDEPPALAAAKKRNRTRSGWNPITFRVPLLRPDRFFDALSPWLGWAFAPWAFLVWAVLGLIALHQLSSHWSRFTASLDGIFAPLNWLWLPLCWFALKLVHESAHGLACKKHGGSVREAGVIFILLLPVSYVDVTSSWRFRSKWHRMFTGAAGMYAELFIASVAALLWSLTGPGLFNSLCFNVVILASVTTLVFNANCLMKFDGYYILSDLLEIPNLYTLARRMISHCALKPFFCARPLPPSLPESRSMRVFIACYGLAAFLWRIAVCTCLIIGATTLFRGAGIILALVAAILWLGVPATRLFRRALRLRNEQGSTRNVTCSTIGLAGIVAFLLLTTVPWPGTLQAPAVVEYSPLTVVRAASPGFVSDVRVHGGQLVENGQILAVLQNEELELELADLNLALEQSEVKSRIYEHERRMAAWQAEAKTVESLQKKCLEKQVQVDKLTVRAPASGRVISRDPETLLGVYLEPGDEIISIGNEIHKELQIAISQDDLIPFKTAVGRSLQVRLPGGRVFPAPLLRISPRASLQCFHSALSAVNGGPLAVKANKSDADERDFDSDNNHELLAPHLVGTVELTDGQSLQLKAGQVGIASLCSHREALGAHLYRSVARWIRSKLRQSAPERAY